MALSDGWPAQSGVADQIEIRKNLAGLIVRDTSGNPRAGVFPRHTNALVTARSDMKVDVAAFEAAAVRAGGPVFLSNDGTVQVTLDPAPVANSRYDVPYVRQKEDGYGGLADGSNGPEFGVQKGAASPTPNKATVLAAIPAGAIPLAAILIPSTATATNSSGVVITQEFPYTALTGTPILFRTTTERDAAGAFVGGQEGTVLNVTYRYASGAWVAWQAPPTSFTPSLSNLSVGNGSLTATYSIAAGVVTYEVLFTLGSTSGVSGNPIIGGLPFSWAQSNQPLDSTVYLIDTSASAGGRFNGNARYASSTSFVIEAQDVSTYVRNIGVSGAVPFAWTSGDEMRITVRGGVS